MSGPDSRVALVEPISFARGVPAPECLALEELADCARAAIERDGATALNYGPAGGYAPLREWIADRHRVEPERVVLTNGSLQGFRFLAELLSPTGTVIVEAPTYDRPLKILAELEAEVICVPLDEEPAVNGGVAFLYTIPTFQNPTGRTLSKERRKGLAERARDGLLVLEDDPYGLVRFEGKPPPTVFELARGQNVVYSSSFSKTVAPGLRVGYLVLPNALAERVVAAATASYITPALLSQATVYEFLRSGKLRAEPRADLRAAARAPRRDDRRARAAPAGGDVDRSGRRLLRLARPPGRDRGLGPARRGVTFVPGSDFFCGPGGESALRLAFSYESPSAIEEGVRRLASAVRAAIVLSRAA